MTRGATIGSAFRDARERGEAALIPFLTAGFPTMAESMDHLRCLEAEGSDVVEIGIPFADPVADGPTIQRSSHIALQHGATLRKILAQLAQVPSSIPRVAMSYLNPLMAFETAELIDSLRLAAVSGLIVPDLPLEEAEVWGQPLEAAGIDLILLAAPTSGPHRLREIGRRSRGFVYYVTVAGTTGSRGALPPELRDRILEMKSHTALPVAAGFGISTAAHVRELSAVADGIVVGSRIVQAIEHREDLATLIRELKSATRSDSHVGGHEIGGKR